MHRGIYALRVATVTVAPYASSAREQARERIHGAVRHAVTEKPLLSTFVQTDISGKCVRGSRSVCEAPKRENPMRLWREVGQGSTEVRRWSGLCASVEGFAILGAEDPKILCADRQNKKTTEN